MTTGVAILET